MRTFLIACCCACLCQPGVHLSAQESIYDVFGNCQVNTMTRRVNGYTIEVNEIKNEDIFSNWKDLEFVWIKISKGAALRAVDVQRTGNFQEIFEGITYGRDLVTINGGFYDDDKKPEGFVVVDQKEVNPYIDWGEGGIVVQQDDFFRIVPHNYYKYLDRSRIRHALQSKPIVVDDGEIAVNRAMRKRQNRIGIGMTEDDEILICLGMTSADRALSLYEFGQLITISERDGGPGGKTLLALDGGPSVHIYIPSMRRHYGIRESGYLPNALKVTAN